MRVVVLCVAFAAMANAALAQTPDVTAPLRVQLATGESPSVALPGVIAHSRHVARIENGRLTGEGGDFLRALGAQSQFVLIGEDHGNAGVANFASAYWRDLDDVGYRYAAVESDPWSTAALERELRAGGLSAWTAFVDARDGAVAAPFFTWAPEVALADTVVHTSDARGGPVLWGLDQVFIGAAPWQLSEIARNARSPEARALAAALAAQANAAGDLNWFGQTDAAPFVALRAALRQRADRALAEQVDAMIASQRIYRPFSGGQGEAWLANTERENMMRQLFLARYRAAERTDGAPPRVMLKFGANHMFRGPTLTHVLGLGGFVTEFAHTTGGGGAISLYATCGPGSSVSGFGGPSAACDEGFNETWAFLADSIDPQALTLYDLRVWRMRPRAWAHLPEDARRFIESYDVLAVVSGAAASEFLPGIAPPPRAGE